MIRGVLRISLACAVLAVAVSASRAQSQSSKKDERSQSSKTTDALEFLGSYSAPNVIVSTETGHTSAHPPAPPADRRLRRIEGGLAILSPWPSDFVWTPQSLTADCNPSGTASVESELTRAESDLRDGDFREAASVYTGLYVLRPACAQFKWNRAVAQSYLQTPEAVAQLLSAVSAAPSPIAGRIFVALDQIAAGDAERARQDLNALLGRNLGAASSQEPARKNELAERELIWARAIVSWASGEDAEARQWLARLTANDANAPSVWFVLGSTALDEARANSRRLDNLAPESDWNRRLEGEALAARYPSLAQRVNQQGSLGGQPAGAPTSAPITAGAAGHALHEAESLPDSPQAFYQRARAALRLSELAYGRAASSPLLGIQLHALRALAAEMQDDEQAAIREYQAGLDENPQSATLHAGLGHIYRERSELEPARLELEKAYGLDSADPSVAFELGDVYLRLGQPAHALELLTRAMDLDPGLLVAQWSRGKACLALGDDKAALADFEAASPADTSGELQWQLARLYDKLGQPQLAAKARQLSDEQRRAVAESKRKALEARP